MRNSERMLRGGWAVTLLAAWIAIFLSSFVPGISAKPQAASSAEVPVVKGGAGRCSADFVVTDAYGKGLYDAKIRIQLKYGFLGAHRLELEVGTNSDGKARLEGLPGKVKKPAAFTVQRGGQSKTVAYDPEPNCHTHHEVTLGEKPTPR